MKKLIFFIQIMILAACGNDVSLENFDRSAWSSDPQGCKEKRMDLTETLRSQRDQLKGLNQQEVIKILGKPDEHELYKRSQKYFIYYLQPGPQCESQTELAPLKLMIRFNALGLSNEVVIKRDFSNQ